MRAIAEGSWTADTNNNSFPKRTPLILLWAFSTVFWSIFTPPHKTFAARVLLFQPSWSVRALAQDLTWTNDLAVTLSVHAIYSYWTGKWQIPSSNILGWLDLGDRSIKLYLQVFGMLGLCNLFAGGIVIRDRYLNSKAKQSGEQLHEQRIDDQVLPPLLLASKTTHSRFFPRKHSFSYSYLLVGVPVGMQGRISSVLSVDSQRHGWFSVDAADHLTRGQGDLSLAEKLKRYLHSQGVTDRDYAFAYLVTAPSFLGYSFNPVSFWYLYDSDTKLKYMVLEVNNTFDERRLYLLKAGPGNDDSVTSADQQPETSVGSDGKRLLFTNTWQKDFHVSPFNSLKGSYSLRATDPLAVFEETGEVRIDNTITLRSSKEHPKIVARVFSTGKPQDPAQISMLETAKFISAWCWVGFATFPRIVWQAFKLFFKQKLHVWFRPEVAASSIGRAYTDDEEVLETFFRAFLTHTVSEASKALRVIYEPAHSDETEVVLYSPGFTYEEDHQRTLTIKVLSPAFYSRFVHYASAKEAFDAECSVTDVRSHTAHVERPELLSVLLDAVAEQDAAQKSSKRWTSVDQVRWACLRRLRCRPAATSYPGDSHTPNLQLSSVSGTSMGGASELDRFARHSCEDGDLYRRIAIRLFLAERLTFGLPVLVAVMDVLVRSSMLLASMLYSENCTPVDILRPRRLEWGDASTFVILMVLANTVHIWSLLKG
ncbi:hypothetical protein LTR08_007387 [Meristemomyces frigidus]|nr:hypothetical protein LTR08_007387 [Meristemomyces frigidus]